MNDDKVHLYSSDGRYYGEFENPVITEQDTISKKKKYYENINNSDNQKKMLRTNNKELGDFVWSNYRISDEYINIAKPSSLTRLVFLSTFLSYDGALKYNNSKPLTSASILKELKLSTREYSRFMNEMKALKIMYEEDGLWKINPNIFYKGKIPQDPVGLSDERIYCMRLYCKAVREIYRQSAPRYHKTLSYVFQIIPYVNRNYNIVCWNPLETDIEKIECMSLGDFCDLIGYDRSNAKRLMKTLFDPMFELDNGRVTSIINMVVVKFGEVDTYRIYINPRVYYAGDDWKQVEALGGFNNPSTKKERN